MNLQAVISGGSAVSPLVSQPTQPHHPITCGTKLRLEEDGSFACEHVTVGPDDERLAYCLNQSIATLIMELTWARFGGPKAKRQS